MQTQKDQEERQKYFTKYRALTSMLAADETIKLDMILTDASIEERSAYLDAVEFGFHAGVRFAAGVWSRDK